MAKTYRLRIVRRLHVVLTVLNPRYIFAGVQSREIHPGEHAGHGFILLHSILGWSKVRSHPNTVTIRHIVLSLGFA